MTEQQYGICRVAVSPLRSEPSDKAEISSQLLFGDHVEILEQREKWWLVRNAYDGYEGWLDPKQLALLTEQQYHKHYDMTPLAPATLANIAVDETGSHYLLSPGSNLPLYQDGYFFIGEERFRAMFEPRLIQAPHAVEDLIATALFFRNVPYLWGGKNMLGIDCSGFTQIVFKLNGIKIRRDAWQQAEEGNVVDFLPEAKAGDMAFFDNAEGRITHVGIMLSNEEIIHASGKVRIDRIDDQGIFNAEMGKYTHNLRIIKRFL